MNLGASSTPKYALVTKGQLRRAHQQLRVVGSALALLGGSPGKSTDIGPTRAANDF
ncbi:hypothetical protein AB0F46_41965 [Streptomyces sp. NPDC026665]|uniref:hypothetical protein n=1 Tax=Streptomyces sp. NPDC026665 TaxID=3154798 RepID=UPI0033CC356F